MRLLCLLICSSALSSAATFPAEISHVFSTAQGLPSNRVHCVAVTGNKIYAGTDQGLAVSSDSATWQPVAGYTGHAVVTCAASGYKLYFTFNGALHQLGAKSTHRFIGRPTALAAQGSKVFLATSIAIYEDGHTIFQPERRMDVRQLAVGPKGELAIASVQGLFIRDRNGAWNTPYPSENTRSWAPFDSRGVAYDREGRLWIATPQGAGVFDGKSWRLLTGAEGLPYDDFTTLAIGEPGVIWFGTKIGAIRYDVKTWEYRQGRRWLPHDEVRRIAVSENGSAWFATSAGVGMIERRPMTLAEKAKFFEDEIDKRHRRTQYGYVMAVHLPNAGDKSKWVQTDSDNDGLWTSMYGAGECFAYAATKDPLAKQRATKAFEALRFLSEVTQGGEHPAPPGFPARAILPTTGPDPNLHDSREHDIKFRAERDHEWKILTPRWPKSGDGKWYWKTDTSSDELDGHYFFYAQYYDLVATTAEEKAAVRKVVAAITDHMLDHDFNLVDWDGKPTRWGIFNPASLNGDRLWWSGRGLNSLSILSYLKVAEHVTGNPRYRAAYDRLVKDHHYATNQMVPKLSAGPGSGNQSDDEMAFMSYYNLIKYETDPNLLQLYAGSLANYWDLEKVELNPFFNFVAAASLKGKSFTDAFRTQDLTPKGEWLEESLDTLRRLPLNRIDWPHRNGHRKDLVPVRSFTPEDDDRTGMGYRVNGKVLPVDERFFEFWNHNPFRLDSGRSGKGLGDGAVYLLPYYMGLYHSYLQ